jgi:hemerythrin-like domain-containing protein
MDAIDILTQQHRDVEALIEQCLEAEDTEKGDLIAQIADQLAVHTAIEERHFYSAAKSDVTEELLQESVVEHLGIKRLLADLLDETDLDKMDAQLEVLKEQLEHHITQEERNLFPKAKAMFDDDQLEAIGQEMTATMADLFDEGEPRRHIPEETEEAPAI